MSTAIQEPSLNRSPKIFSDYLQDQDYINQAGSDRLVQLYSQSQRRDANL